MKVNYLGSIFCAVAFSLLAQPLSADPIYASFRGAPLVSSAPDSACPAPAHAYGTYSGPGGGLLNYSPDIRMPARTFPSRVHSR